MAQAKAKRDIPKAYDPKAVEQRIYERWVESGHFTSQIDPSKKPFVVIMPPPNVTGELHMGHALTTALQDLMVRWHRMKGDPTLYLPGMDHAGIATQVVVERALAQDDITRHQLGRQKFVEQVWEWVVHIVRTEALPGMWNTVVLTQVVLAGSGLFALLLFGTICRHFVSRRRFRGLSHYVLIVLRTTPEYILAYVFLQLWGPSMLPAILAILLHNGAILSYLTGQNANLVRLRMDSSRRKMNRYFFEVLPRVYGQFLAFLFYRWEVMMRESAILGILGISTIGFFIDSAIADDKVDKAVFLIFTTALLNMGIDSISQIIRRRLRVSAGAVFAHQQ